MFWECLMKRLPSKRRLPGWACGADVWGLGQWGRLKGYEACLCFLVVSQVGRVIVPHVQRRGERDHRVAVLRLARVPAI